MIHLFQAVTTALVAVLALTTCINAGVRGGARRRHHSHLHHNLVAREEGQVLQRRSFPGQATFYEISEGDQGACGEMLHSTDYIVALNKPQYGDLNSKSSFCGKTIIISYGGKTAKARIVDACPECAHGSLDMSQALFDHFASEDKGVFQMEWSLEGDSHATTADLAAKKEAEEDAANRKKKEQEDAANRTKAEEEAAANRKKAEEEAALKKKKADEEAAKKKKEDDQRRADAAAKKAADDKKAADEKAALEKKKQDDQKAKDAAAEEEKRKAEQEHLQQQQQQQPPPTQTKDKKGGSEPVAAHHETTNIASFKGILQGLDQIVQDASSQNKG